MCDPRQTKNVVSKASSTRHKTFEHEKKKSILNSNDKMKFTSAFLLAGSATAFTSNNSAQRTQSVQLNLFGNKDENMSQALPFAAKPKLLDGSMAGDAGFE